MTTYITQQGELVTLLKHPWGETWMDDKGATISPPDAPVPMAPLTAADVLPYLMDGFDVLYRGSDGDHWAKYQIAEFAPALCTAVRLVHDGQRNNATAIVVPSGRPPEEMLANYQNVSGNAELR